MRQISFSILGIALLMSAACAKVEEPAVVQPVPAESADFQIKATIDHNSIDTKTAYMEDATAKKAVITWVNDDKIKLLAYASADPYSANWYTCDIDESTINGDQATFKARGAISTDYPLSYYAVYPADLTISGTKDNYSITLPAEYTVTGTDFTQVKVPLIGTVDSGNEYVFTTATGVLKITLSNVPVNARKVVLTTTGDNLSGAFPLDAANGLQMNECTSPGNSITVNFPQQAAGSTISVYMPVPVGTISAGATFQVQDGSGNAIKTTAATKKAISIVRGHLLPLPTISVEDWVSLGTGKYMDDHGFYYLYKDGRSADDYADVTIERHATETGRYRIYQPYASCPQVNTGLPNAADYLYIDIKDATRGIVANHSYKYDNDSKIMFDAPYWGYDNLYHNSRIIKYDGDGNPANIQLAPYYYNFYSANCAQNPKIEIVFPGSTPMMANVFNYANGASAAYDNGNVSVTISNTNITGIKVKAATGANEAAAIDAGVTALMNGQQDLTFDAAGSQPLALADGTYYLVYMVETNGHGSTFKKSAAFNVISKTEIPLTSSMISVNIDAGDHNGHHYDGAGPGALVDNDITTFWHTPYYDAQTMIDYADWFNQNYGMTGGSYSYSDLDATYGAYIDIDLGGSKTVNDFQIRACLRNGNGDFPKHVIVYTSVDGNNWDKVAEVDNICAGIAAGAWINPIDCANSTAARYIRFSIIENTSGKDLRNPSDQGCTHLAEIKIYE